MSFFQRQKDMIPKKNTTVFSVCNSLFMICSREFNFTENEKTELIFQFVIPAEAFTQASGSISPSLAQGLEIIYIWLLMNFLNIPY